MVDKLARALIYLSGRSDLIVAILMLVAIAMIIIPLPTWLVDGLIALNIMLRTVRDVRGICETCASLRFHCRRAIARDCAADRAWAGSRRQALAADR